MPCTIGWAGTTVELPSPFKITRDSGTLNLKGSFAATVDEAKILVAQLLGYGVHNTAEPIVEFTYDTAGSDADIDGDLDGFYYVVEMAVDYTKLGAGLFDWSAELVALENRCSPLFEVTSVGAVRDNTIPATGDPWVAFPGAADNAALDGGAAPTVDSIMLPNGQIRVFASTGDDYLYEGSLRYRTSVEEYRVGACAVERTFDGGSSWHPVPGEEIPFAPTGWRLTNGRCRASLVGQAIRVELWDDAAGGWETQDFILTADTGGGYSGLIDPDLITAVSILRNGLERATLRVTTVGLVTVDFSIRRGGSLVEMLLTTGDGDTVSFAITPDPTTAATAITAGGEATGANADGNKWVMLSPEDSGVTLDVLTGEFAAANVLRWPVAIGVSNADLITGVTATEQYFANNHTSQKVIDG